MKENEKQMGACSTSFPKNFNNKTKNCLYKVLFGHYIPPKTMQITKMRKAINYYRDKMGRNQKKRNKSKKDWLEKSHAAPAKFCRGCENSQGLRICEISQPLRNWQGFGASSLFASHSSFCLLVLQLCIPIDFFMLELLWTLPDPRACATRF